MNRSLRTLPVFCALIACAPCHAEQVTLTVVDDTCLVQDAGADDNNFGGRVEILTSNNGTSGAARRFGLLRFDVSSLAGQFSAINSMTLKLRLRSGGSRTVPTTGQILDIFRIADANAGWVEGTGLSSAANDGVTAVDTVSYRAKKDNADALLRSAWAGSAGLSTSGTDYFASALGSTLAFNAASGYAPGTVISIPFTASGFTLTEMVNAWITLGAGTNAGLLIRGRSGTANGQIFLDAIESTDAGAQPAQLVINYTPGTSSPYLVWAQTHGLAGADVDPTADPDGDNAVNLLEYALDGDPRSGAADGKQTHAVVTQGDGSALTMTIPVRNGAVFAGVNALTASQDGVQYTVRASGDLAEWGLDVDEVTPALSSGLPALTTGWTYRTFRVADPVGSRPRAYFQVVVSQVP